MEEYSKEQLWELYKELPNDLQKAFFSKEIGGVIKETCLENNVTDERQMSLVLKYTGYIFLGLLPPNDLTSVFEKETEIKKEDAEEIFKNINNKILLNLKKSIEDLYGIEIKKEEVKEKTKAQDKYIEPID